MSDWILLTAWRLRYLRFRCLIGRHRWVGDDDFRYCENCPTDADFISAGFPAYVAYWHKYASPKEGMRP